MNQQAVDQYLAVNSKYFAPDKMEFLRQKLLVATEDQFMRVTYLSYKDPFLILMMSIFLGGWGVDRFLMDDVVMGLVKIFTACLCGILWIYDIVTMSGKAKEMNFNNVMAVLNS